MTFSIIVVTAMTVVTPVTPVTAVTVVTEVTVVTIIYCYDKTYWDKRNGITNRNGENLW